MTMRNIVFVAMAMTAHLALAVNTPASQVFSSASQRGHLLEVYTSEGCSSCPPADKWLSGLIEREDLWTSVVPVAFHVDYWDHLGWPDPFARASFGQRQRDHAATWTAGGIYTPGFVLNGNEWRGWFGRQPLLLDDAGKAGVLRVEVDDGAANVSFKPEDNRGGSLSANVAVLGFGIARKVTAGENKGRDLLHDFVVMDFQSVPMRSTDNVHEAVAELALPRGSKAERLAIAVWIETRGDLAPVQVTGGWLTEASAATIGTGETFMKDKVVKSESEWRETLSDEEYLVAREKGTERAFTGRYWNNKDEGVYLCVACGLPLFDSGTKFESGTGWPSFWKPVNDKNVGEKSDSSLGMVRTEVVCNRCDSHLGHLFDDGPRPTGLRYCLNSAALRFVPKTDKSEK